MLKAKTAVVTGSTSGIGLGVARALAREGANVLLNGFGAAAEIEKTRATIEAEFGVKAAYSPADLAKGAEIAAMIKTAEQTLGAIDILVNNAGIQHVAPVEEFPIEKWDAILAINLSAAFHTVRAVVPGMKARKWGRIINTASAHSLVASPFKVAYISAKHGLAGLTKTEIGARRGAGHEGAQVGPHHQHRLGALAGRLAVQGRLHLGQARAGGTDQDRDRCAPWCRA